MLNRYDHVGLTLVGSVNSRKVVKMMKSLDSGPALIFAEPEVLSHDAGTIAPRTVTARPVVYHELNTQSLAARVSETGEQEPLAVTPRHDSFTTIDLNDERLADAANTPVSKRWAADWIAPRLASISQTGRTLLHPLRHAHSLGEAMPGSPISLQRRFLQGSFLAAWSTGVAVCFGPLVALGIGLGLYKAASLGYDYLLRHDMLPKAWGTSLQVGSSRTQQIVDAYANKVRNRRPGGTIELRALAQTLGIPMVVVVPGPNGESHDVSIYQGTDLERFENPTLRVSLSDTGTCKVWDSGGSANQACLEHGTDAMYRALLQTKAIKSALGVAADANVNKAMVGRLRALAADTILGRAPSPVRGLAAQLQDAQVCAEYLGLAPVAAYHLEHDPDIDMPYLTPSTGVQRNDQTLDIFYKPTHGWGVFFKYAGQQASVRVDAQGNLDSSQLDRFYDPCGLAPDNHRLYAALLRLKYLRLKQSRQFIANDRGDLFMFVTRHALMELHQVCQSARQRRDAAAAAAPSSADPSLVDAIISLTLLKHAAKLAKRRGFHTFGR